MNEGLIRFSGRNDELFQQLKSLDSSIEEALRRVGDKLSEFEPTLLTEWLDQGLWPKIEAYSLRYVLPLYELMKPPQTESTDILVVQLLACVSWRHFDDCLDAHGSIIAASMASSSSCLRLHEYARRLASGSVRKTLERHYAVMAEQAKIERTRPVELQDIWKRCSIFMFSPEAMANLADERLEVFRCYINYSGIAHDIHDFMTDAAEGVRSLPVTWMNELNPEGVFSVSKVRSLYENLRRRVVPLEQQAGELQISVRFPLINHLWLESWRTIHHE
jgi:hypothetical protein